MSSSTVSTEFILLPSAPFYLGDKTIIVQNGWDILVKILQALYVTLPTNYVKDKGKGNFTIYQYDNYYLSLIKIRSYFDAEKNQVLIEFTNQNKTTLANEYYYQTWKALLNNGFKITTTNGKTPLKRCILRTKSIDEDFFVACGLDMHKAREEELHSFLTNDFWDIPTVLRMAESILLKCEKYNLEGWKYLVWWNLDTRYKECLTQFKKSGLNYQVHHLTMFHIFWTQLWDKWSQLYPLSIESFYQRLGQVKTLLPISKKESSVIFHQVISNLMNKAAKDLPSNLFGKKKCLLLPPLPKAAVRSVSMY